MTGRGVERYAEQLMAIRWERASGHARSRSALMREYLRRAADWAYALDCVRLWPFFDVAARLHPDRPHLRAPADLVSRVRAGAPDPLTADLLEFALHFKGATSWTDFDVFGPLVSLYERGGAFTVLDGLIDLGEARLEIGTAAEHHRPEHVIVATESDLKARDAQDPARDRVVRYVFRRDDPTLVYRLMTGGPAPTATGPLALREIGSEGTRQIHGPADPAAESLGRRLIAEADELVPLRDYYEYAGYPHDVVAWVEATPFRARSYHGDVGRSESDVSERFGIDAAVLYKAVNDEIVVPGALDPAGDPVYHDWFESNWAVGGPFGPARINPAALRFRAFLAMLGAQTPTGVPEVLSRAVRLSRTLGAYHLRECLDFDLSRVYHFAARRPRIPQDRWAAELTEALSNTWLHQSVESILRSESQWLQRAEAVEPATDAEREATLAPLHALTGPSGLDPDVAARFASLAARAERVSDAYAVVTPSGRRVYPIAPDSGLLVMFFRPGL